MSLCLKAWQSRAPGHLLKEINTLPSSFSECNGLDITSPVGHYGAQIINPSYRVCAPRSVCACLHVSQWAQNVYVSAYVHNVSVCLRTLQRGTGTGTGTGGFACTVWGNLSPREKVIRYLYTSSAGSSKAAVNLNYTNPSLPRPPSPPPPLPCHRWQWTKSTAHCCVPRLTIGFGLSLRGHGYVGVLPFIWAYGRLLPFNHAAPPQGALCGLG